MDQVLEKMQLNYGLENPWFKSHCWRNDQSFPWFFSAPSDKHWFSTYPSTSIVC